MCTYLESDSDESDCLSVRDDVGDDDNPSCDITSTWIMKNCSIDDTKKDTTFTVSPMLNGHLRETPTDWITLLNGINIHLHIPHSGKVWRGERIW